MWDYFFQCKMGELRNWPQVWIIRLSQLKAIMSVVLETANSLAWCNTTAQQCSKSPNHSNNNIDNNNKTSRPVHHVHMYICTLNGRSFNVDIQTGIQYSGNRLDCPLSVHSLSENWFSGALNVFDMRVKWSRPPGTHVSASFCCPSHRYRYRYRNGRDVCLEGFMHMSDMWEIPLGSFLCLHNICISNGK